MVLSYEQCAQCMESLGYRDAHFNQLLFALLLPSSPTYLEQTVSCATLYDALLVLVYNGRRSELLPCFADYVTELYQE